MVYARTINGEELTFGVSGMLLKNALVMYDHQTDSLWSQFLGEAIQGPHEGSHLQLLSGQVTTWERWKQEHPSTTAIDKMGIPPLGSRSFFFEPGGIDPLAEPGAGLNSYDLVLALDGVGAARAYPLRHLLDTGVVNDSFEGQPIVITYDGLALANVFKRSLAGRDLTFWPINSGRRVSSMRDAQTGTTWRAATGEAVEGPLKGARLEQVPSYLSFWFAWRDYHPDGESPANESSMNRE